MGKAQLFDYEATDFGSSLDQTLGEKLFLSCEFPQLSDSDRYPLPCLCSYFAVSFNQYFKEHFGR
jgi:hypothetical protein